MFFSTSRIPAVSSLRGEEIREKTMEIMEDLIRPLNAQYLGPLGRSPQGTQTRPSMPFVFCLGNHSSGKSTFINHVLGQKIQSTGVAPTDDSFTVIAPGKQDLDQDGPALVGNPEAGFSGLRTFGEGLVNGALTARVGVAAMEVCRPLPFRALERPRVTRLVRRALTGLFDRE